jgi:DNA primase
MREGRQASFMFLPEGEDPDTLVRRLGPEGFRAELARSVPLSVFLLEQLGRKVDLTTLDGRARLVELARPLVARLPPGAFRQLLEKRLAELARLETRELQGVLGVPGEGPRPAQARPLPPVTRQAPSLMRRTVSLLLHHPEIAAGVEAIPALAAAQLPGAQVLAEMLELLSHRPQLTTGGLLEHFRGTEAGRHLERLAQGDELLAPGADLAREFRDSLQRIASKAREERFRELQDLARQRELTPAETHEYGELCARIGGQGEYRRP